MPVYLKCQVHIFWDYFYRRISPVLKWTQRYCSRKFALTQQIREIQVKSLGQEDPLEKEMATHSSILAWKNPMDEGAWWVTVQGVTKSWTWLSDFTFTFFSIYCIVLLKSLLVQKPKFYLFYLRWSNEYLLWNVFLIVF